MLVTIIQLKQIAGFSPKYFSKMQYNLKLNDALQIIRPWHTNYNVSSEHKKTLVQPWGMTCCIGCYATCLGVMNIYHKFHENSFSGLGADFCIYITRPLTSIFINVSVTLVLLGW